MKIHPEFPEHQRRDPNLKAVLEAYDEIASSPQAGAALYHRPDDPKPCGLDFTIWVEETARFGLSVANGEYCVAEGQWLHSTDGTTAKRRSSPIHRTALLGDVRWWALAARVEVGLSFLEIAGCRCKAVVVPTTLGNNKKLGGWCPGHRWGPLCGRTAVWRVQDVARRVIRSRRWCRLWALSLFPFARCSLPA